jgi:nitric oxide reductase large subunit
MGGKPYKNWEEVKNDIKFWNYANKTCLVIALLFIIAGVVAEAFNYDFILAPTSWFLLAVVFAVISIAPHISFIALKSWYGVESERKNK